MITLRLGLFQCEEKRAKELAEAIVRQKGSADTVWLTTIGYYPELNYHKKIAEGWVSAAKIFREAGLKVSLQVANTMGHRDWEFLKPEKNNPFSFGMREGGELYDLLVHSDGEVNKSRYCFRGERFRKYIKDVAEVYLKLLKPDRLWFDDDLRAMGKTAGCYCEKCINLFNDLNGTNYTREELVYKMDYEDTDLRKKYVEFVKDGMYDFVYDISKYCLKVQPDLTFGYEYAQDQVYTGADVDYIIKGFYDASGKTVHTRPGGGYYNDKSPFGQFAKAFMLDYAISRTPEYADEREAEIENLPGVAYGKSIQGIINEGTLDLAAGCTDLSFTDVQSCHESMEYYEKILSAFSDVLPYWKKLSNVSKKGIRSGAGIFVSDEPNMRKLSLGEPSFGWTKLLLESDYSLMRAGIPITHDLRKASCYILNQRNTAVLKDSEIEFLLTQPVIADGESVEMLIKRGYGDCFPFVPKEIKDDNAFEYFTDDSINIGYEDIFFSENPYAAVPVKRYVYEKLNNRTRVLGNMYRNPLIDDGSFLGAATILSEVSFKNSKTKWGIFGYSLFGDIISRAKRNQIIKTMDEISIMPATLVSMEQAVINPVCNEKGETMAVTVMSASQNGTDETKLIVRKPAGEKYTVMSSSRKRENSPEIKITKNSDGSVLAELSPLLPYEAVTLFID